MDIASVLGIGKGGGASGAAGALGSAAAGAATLGEGAGGVQSSAFAAALQGKATNSQLHDKAEEAAGGLVANALILPVLQQVRRSPWAENSVFSGGMGEKMFGPEFDMQIADRLAHSPNMTVTHVLAKRLEKNLAAKTQTAKLDVHG